MVEAHSPDSLTRTCQNGRQCIGLLEIIDDMTHHGRSYFLSGDTIVAMVHIYTCLEFHSFTKYVYMNYLRRVKTLYMTRGLPTTRQIARGL